MSTEKKSLSGLIISAGYSSRMEEFKPLMTYDGLPFLLTIILKLKKICQQICIVTGYNSQALQNEIYKLLDGTPPKSWLKKNDIEESEWHLAQQCIKFSYNPRYHLGMFSSLQVGLKSLQDTTWILYHFVDQPHIPTELYPVFARQISVEYDWIQPIYKKQKGHPIIINQRLIYPILKRDPDAKLNEVVRAIRPSIKYWECNSAGILKDFDTKQDFISYEK